MLTTGAMLSRGIVPHGSFQFLPADVREESADVWDSLTPHNKRHHAVVDFDQFLGQENPQAEDRRLICGLLRDCTFTEKKILVLLFYKDFNLSEVARYLHLTFREADKLLERAKMKMYERLETMFREVLETNEIN